MEQQGDMCISLHSCGYSRGTLISGNIPFALRSFLYCFFSIIFCFLILELFLVSCWTPNVDFEFSYISYILYYCIFWRSYILYFYYRYFPPPLPFILILLFLRVYSTFFSNPFTKYFISILYLISKSSYVLWLPIFNIFSNSYSFLMGVIPSLYGY